MKKLLPLLLALSLVFAIAACGQPAERIWRHPGPDGTFTLDEPGIVYRMLLLSLQPWRTVYRMEEDGTITLHEELMWDEVGETRYPSEQVAALFGQPIEDRDDAADLAEAILAQEQAEGNFRTVSLVMVTDDPIEDIWVLSFREPGAQSSWDGVVFDVAVRGETGDLVRMWVGGALLADE